MATPEIKTLLPEGWARGRGYSHAIISQGTRWLTIAGQLPAPSGKLPVEPGLEMGEQFNRALTNVVALVKAAGGTADNITCLRAFVTSIAEFNAAGKGTGEAWGRLMGKHFPAMTLVECSKLVDPNAKVEIEAMALLP
jgi:enamine deaminase RidA (YjgF/YER057c/UK114 family)